jgi:hypothetical protein
LGDENDDRPADPEYVRWHFRELERRVRSLEQIVPTLATREDVRNVQVAIDQRNQRKSDEQRQWLAPFIASLVGGTGAGLLLLAAQHLAAAAPVTHP